MRDQVRVEAQPFQIWEEAKTQHLAPRAQPAPLQRQTLQRVQQWAGQQLYGLRKLARS